MCEKTSCPVRRRALLAAIGSSCLVGPGVVSAQSESTTNAAEGSRGPVYFASIDVTPLGTGSPSEGIPIDVSQFAAHERKAIETSLKTGSTVIDEHPSFPSYFFTVSDGIYFEVDTVWNDLEDKVVPTLKAEPVDVSVHSVSAQDASKRSACDPMKRAIGRARAHRRRGKSNGTGVETHSNGRGRARGRDGVPPGLRVRQEAYTFDPHEKIPEELEEKGELLVHDNGDPYRLTLEEREASVETFEITSEEVTTDANTFDEWFVDEFVVTDVGSDSLSKAESEILESAVANEYTEQSDYSDELKGVLDRLRVQPESMDRAYRYARIDGELLQITVNQSIGC